MSIAKQYIDLQLSRNIVTSIPCLSEIKQQFKINIHIIDTQKIKAFTHRKKIYLSVGLLERLNDDELKAVVAHEIYHLKHSPNKFLSSLLALASLTFRRFNDEHSADRYAAKTAGIHNLINALRKLEIKNYKERARRLYLES
jgi:heat shock protein HtpX